MAIHDIAVEIPKATVTNTDVVIIVKRNGRRLGVLTLSRGSIDWRATKDRSKRSMNWTRFAQVMEEQGSEARTATTA